MPYADPDKQREFQRRRWQRIKIEAKGKILARKNGGCVICGEKDPVVIQFHHVDPKKKSFDIGFLLGSKMSEQRLEEELDKCVPLCANCHMRVHAGTATLP